MKSVENLPFGFKLMQKAGVFPLGTDAVLLAAFAPTGKNICDLGAGAGAVSMLLAAQRKNVEILCVELETQAAALCAENIALNGISGRARVLNADLKTVGFDDKRENFVLVVANPPYMKSGGGKPASSDALRIAREESSANLGDFCAAAARLLKNGGNFAICCPPTRLTELFCELRSAGLEPKRMIFAAHDHEKKPFLALVSAKKGGAAGLNVEPTLFLNLGGETSPKYAEILAGGTF